MGQPAVGAAPSSSGCKAAVGLMVVAQFEGGTFQESAARAGLCCVRCYVTVTCLMKSLSTRNQG
jgi:hypothetical protein